MPNLTRRKLLQSTAATAATLLANGQLATAQAAPATPTQRRNHINQSVSRWCYQKIPLDDLCAYSAKIGLKGIDLLTDRRVGSPSPLRPHLHHGLRRRRRHQKSPQP